jgi:outer membrane protein OmpA-like peptidoglycan-associated protein
MDIAIMTHHAPRRTHLRTTKHGRSWQRVALLAGLGLIAASSSPAQTVIGGNRAPSVSVDLTVLERLGPAPNLPQLFGASHRSAADPAATAPRPTLRPAPQLALQAPAATTKSTKKHPVAQRTAHRPAKDSTRLAQAPQPQRLATAPDRAVHLVPPAAQTGSGGPRVVRDQPLLTPPIQSAAMATNTPVPAPAPMPKLPQSAEPPAPPVLAPVPAHDETPSPPPQPPTQARNDAPVSLTAVPPPAPTATADSPAAPTTDNAVAGGSRPTQVQIASAASIGSVVNTVKFAAGTTDLPTSSKSVLDTVAGKLLGDDALRVQLVAHATGGADQAMEARRVSLARAVAVRAYLIDKGVRSLRMDVRALGNRSDDGPATDQVDLLIVSQ